MEFHAINGFLLNPGQPASQPAKLTSQPKLPSLKALKPKA
tara:strand:- start:107 stop:226 length:120 start_codon:yes stop_codon:yes gene_type:complete